MRVYFLARRLSYHCVLNILEETRKTYWSHFCKGKKTHINAWGVEVLTNLIGVIILRYIHECNHHVVHLNLHMLYVSDILIKLGRKSDVYNLWLRIISAHMCEECFHHHRSSCWMALLWVILTRNCITVTFEQHGFELHGSIYVWIFFK